MIAKTKALTSGGRLLACLVLTFYSESSMATDQNRLINMVNDVRTVCIGRFVVDVPKSAQIVYGPARIPVEIWRQEGQGKNLMASIDDAVAKVEARRSHAYQGLLGPDSVVGRVMDGIHENHKLVFAIAPADGSFYNVQSFLALGSDLFLQEYLASGQGLKYLDAVKEANSVAQLLRARAENEFPAEPGLCVDGAFLSEPKEYMRESVSLGIRLKEFQDVHISIEMIKKSYVVESDALEPRLASAEREAKAAGMWEWYSSVKTLRRGARSIGKWNGFEVLVHKPAQQHEGENHEFVFVSQGEPKNPILPVITIELHSGVESNMIGRTKPSITDVEAQYLWDKVTSSIRPRETNSTY